MSANREYKSSVFTTLFNDESNLLSLYNAVSGSDLPSDTPLEIATLEDVLFTDRRNDIAFVVKDKIVILLEHQSTINENMPLRMLIYIARVYEKLIDNEAIYKSKLLKIPKPDFIVLYNGTDPFPDEKMLYLSDAYNDSPEALVGLGGSMNLEVRVININFGRNNAIIKNSDVLYGYVQFINKIRENQQAGLDLKSAITTAARDCIKDGILVDFLKLHSSEVINMLTTEWNYEVAQKVWKEEAREEGLEEGRKEGISQGVDISADIIRELIKKTPIEEIAKRYKVSIEKIKQLQSVLLQLPT